MLVVIDNRHYEVLMVQGSLFPYYCWHHLLEVPHYHRLVFRGRSHEFTVDGLGDSPDPLVVLLDGLEQETIVAVPDTDRVVPGAANQMISLGFDVLYAADFVLMALQGPVTTIFLVFVPLPKLDRHVSSTTSQVLACRTKSHVVDHASVLS